MSEGRVVFSIEDQVGSILFDRPAARNAMTDAMYAELAEICARLAEPGALRAVVLRGAGGEAFVAGTDIGKFLDFAGGEDGLAYEAEMGRILEALAAIPIPVVAVIEGWALGGGLNIAACADIRIATTGSRFGAPVARTLGNCLSVDNYARLLAGFGEGRARRMLLLGETLSAQEALAAGFLSRVAEPAELEATLQKLLSRLLANAPLTLRASKAALNRLMATSRPNIDDLIRLCYASEDFHMGVRAFLAKEKPVWRGI
jgi:enoyl-CoA hydratase/carnithine racemase